MPRFGGYDLLGVVRGVAVPGDPQVWLVAQQRLFLFQTRATRDAFAAAPDRLLAAAQEKWPEVAQTLVP